MCGNRERAIRRKKISSHIKWTRILTLRFLSPILRNHVCMSFFFYFSWITSRLVAAVLINLIHFPPFLFCAPRLSSHVVVGVSFECARRGPNVRSVKRQQLRYFIYFSFIFVISPSLHFFSPSSSSFLFSLSCAFFLFSSQNSDRFFFCAVAAGWLDVTNDQILFFLPLFFFSLFDGSYISPLYVLSTLNFLFFLRKCFKTPNKCEPRHFFYTRLQQLIFTQFFSSRSLSQLCRHTNSFSSPEVVERKSIDYFQVTRWSVFEFVCIGLLSSSFQTTTQVLSL